MQVVVNERFLDRRAMLARVGTYGGISILGIGFIVSLSAEAIVNALLISPSWIIISTWISMVTGFTIFNIGRYNAARWVTRPREDEVLALGLKGLDHRHRLLNYMPQTRANHVLVGPSGVYVIHTRNQAGTILNQGGRWTRKFTLGVFLRSMFEGGFGNPTQDVTRETYSVAHHMSAIIPAEEAAQVRLQPLVVFVDPRVKLTVRDPSVPVLTPKELKSYMRKQAKEVRLNNGQLEKIAEGFGI